MRRTIRSANLLLALLLFISAVACKSGTNNPNSSVVQLRDKLIEFAKGNLNEIQGTTRQGEIYILLSGYPETAAEKQLPISDKLRKRLERISPPRSFEILVLAQIMDDEIQEYTEWRYTGANYHPVLSPVPVVIKGNPYRITQKGDRSGIVNFEVQN